MSEVQERADRAMSESFSLRARLREVDGLQSVVDRLKSDLENQKREFEDRLGHKASPVQREERNDEIFAGYGDLEPEQGNPKTHGEVR